MHFGKHIGEAYSPPPQFTNSPDKFCLGNNDELPEGLAVLTLVGRKRSLAQQFAANESAS